MAKFFKFKLKFKRVFPEFYRWIWNYFSLFFFFFDITVNF